MKAAFNNKFLDKNGVIYSNNTPTANILALAFGLVPNEYQDKIVDNLLQKLFAENGGHVGSGIIGGQWMMRALTQTGHADVAYTLATQTTYPSWGYMVEQGATTIWELWNGDHGDPGMNSGNHVMLLGDLIIWYYENLAGIKADPEIPAFKHIVMKPYVLGDLTSVDASYNSVYGMIKSAWKLENDKFEWNITIPANTTATVYVPTLDNENVMESGRKASKSEGVRFIKREGYLAVFEVESGSYTFTSKGVKKINTGSYLANPVITPADTVFALGKTYLITITSPDTAASIRYSLDGSELNESSPVYEKPIEISGNTVVKAQAFAEG